MQITLYIDAYMVTHSCRMQVVNAIPSVQCKKYATRSCHCLKNYNTERDSALSKTFVATLVQFSILYSKKIELKVNASVTLLSSNPQIRTNCLIMHPWSRDYVFYFVLSIINSLEYSALGGFI